MSRPRKQDLLKERAMVVSTMTANAWSRDRYTDWQHVAFTLLTCGFSELEVVAIMRSKWTRWAADAADKSDNATAEDLLRWMRKQHANVTHRKQEVRKLVLETFPAVQSGT